MGWLRLFGFACFVNKVSMSLDVKAFRNLPWVYRHPKRSEMSSQQSWVMACDRAWGMRKGLSLCEIMNMECEGVPVMAVSLCNTTIEWFAQSSQGAVVSKGCIGTESLCQGSVVDFVECVQKVSSEKGVLVAYDTGVAVASMKKMFQEWGGLEIPHFERSFSFKECLRLSKAGVGVPEAALHVLQQLESTERSNNAERLAEIYGQGRDKKLWL